MIAEAVDRRAAEETVAEYDLIIERSAREQLY
jgi:hypothetical protein